MAAVSLSAQSVNVRTHMSMTVPHAQWLHHRVIHNPFHPNSARAIQTFQINRRSVVAPLRRVCDDGARRVGGRRSRARKLVVAAAGVERGRTGGGRVVVGRLLPLRVLVDLLARRRGRAADGASSAQPVRLAQVLRRARRQGEEEGRAQGRRGFGIAVHGEPEGAPTAKEPAAAASRRCIRVGLLQPRFLNCPLLCRGSARVQNVSSAAVLRQQAAAGLQYQQRPRALAGEAGGDEGRRCRRLAARDLQAAEAGHRGETADAEDSLHRRRAEARERHRVTRRNAGFRYCECQNHRKKWAARVAIRFILKNKLSSLKRTNNLFRCLLLNSTLNLKAEL